MPISAASALAILNFRVSTYARNIYLLGTNRLTSRDGFPGVPDDYYASVEQYAATGLVNSNPYPSGFTGYTTAQIDTALSNGWITQQEYDETIAYRV